MRRTYKLKLAEELLGLKDKQLNMATFILKSGFNQMGIYLAYLNGSSKDSLLCYSFTNEYKKATCVNLEVKIEMLREDIHRAEIEMILNMKEDMVISIEYDNNCYNKNVNKYVEVEIAEEINYWNRNESERKTIALSGGLFEIQRKIVDEIGTRHKHRVKMDNIEYNIFDFLKLVE